jgi:2-keto-4-pentenoate hydratase/2-oxohepta-3-ene-1,7-dioic acid hydratase in catechol pathway
MRFVTFAHEGRVRPGALVPGRTGEVLDLGGVVDGLPPTLAEVLAAPPALHDALRAALASPDPAHVRADGVRLLAPVPRPGKILCVGYNYRGHEATGADPQFPDVFAKTANTVVGPQDDVILPRASDEVDYEAELAVVIGRTAHEVAPEDALRHVGGYTLFNDVSARDWQRRTSQWALGKSFDTFGPLGPAVVTPDEVPDPHALDLELRLNGEVTVRASTRDMVFRVDVLVSYLSQVMTLEPGDVIATGTPQKLPGALRTQRPLRDGDQTTITIGGVGTLTTTFVGPAPATRTTDDERRGERA